MHGWKDIDPTQLPRPRKGRRTSVRAMQKAGLREHVREVKSALKTGHCTAAFNLISEMADGSRVPGRKTAARKLKKTFINKCLRVK